MDDLAYCHATLKFDAFESLNNVDPSHLNLLLCLMHAIVREKLVSAYFANEASFLCGGFRELTRLLAAFCVIGYAAKGAEDHLVAALKHVVARATLVGFFVLGRVDWLLRREDLIVVPEIVADPV